MRVRVRDGAYAVEMASVARVRNRRRDLLGLPLPHGQRARDARRAVLCGSRRCRVSYLHFAGHDDTSCVLKKEAPSRTSPPRCSAACGPCGDGRARTERCSVANDERARSGSAAIAAAADAALARARRRGSRAARGDDPGDAFRVAGVAHALRRVLRRVRRRSARRCAGFGGAASRRRRTRRMRRSRARRPSLARTNEIGAASDAEAEAEGVPRRAAAEPRRDLGCPGAARFSTRLWGGQDRHRAAASGGAGRRPRHRAPRGDAATRRRPRPRSAWTCRKIERLARQSQEDAARVRRELSKLGARWRREGDVAAHRPVAQVDTHVVSAACSAARGFVRPRGTNEDVLPRGSRSCVRVPVRRWASSSAAATPARRGARRTGL